MGHALFVLGIYKGVSRDEHSLKRVGLAVANAVVTFSLLVFVQKQAMRWLREAELSGLSSVSPTGLTSSQNETNAHVTNGVPTVSVSDIEAQLGTERYASRCTTFSQVVLGAFLSVIAAAEIFFLVAQLPLGGLA